MTPIDRLLIYFLKPILLSTFNSQVSLNNLVSAKTYHVLQIYNRQYNELSVYFS